MILRYTQTVFSTSMPQEIQELFIKTIPGLEEASIIKPGYAVEYDLR
jgi:tRNA uridine 5-carboxymethylaminomethyl modification enzyme